MGGAGRGYPRPGTAHGDIYLSGTGQPLERAGYADNAGDEQLNQPRESLLIFVAAQENYYYKHNQEKGRCYPG